jgi:hypothetical protein
MQTTGNAIVSCSVLSYRVHRGLRGHLFYWYEHFKPGKMVHHGQYGRVAVVRPGQRPDAINAESFLRRSGVEVLHRLFRVGTACHELTCSAQSAIYFNIEFYLRPPESLTNGRECFAES